MDSQSLPSPAPSDDPDPKSPRQFLPDTIADPARAETALTLFRQGRPSSSNLANSHVGTMASLPIQMPVPPHVPDPVSSPHPNTSTFSHSNAIPSPKSNAFARSGSNTVPPRDQNATPNQNMPPLRIPNNPPLQTWAGRPFQQPNVASQAHGHPGSPRVPYSLDILSPTLCLPIIDNFAAHYGAQFNRADTIRLNLLREAIVNSDFFYLVLSALSCRRLLGQPLQTPGQQFPWHGFNLVDQILTQDAQPSLHVLQFLSSFPQPLEVLMQRLGPVRFSKFVTDVARCLEALHNSWQGVIQACSDNEIIPLTENLERVLGIVSPTFQRVTVRAIITRTWQAWTPLATRALNGFVIAQHNFYTQGKPSGDVTTAQRLEYQSLYRQHVRQVTRGQPPPAQSSPPPVLPPQGGDTAQQNVQFQPRHSARSHPQYALYTPPQHVSHPIQRSGAPRLPQGPLLPARGVIASQPAIPNPARSALHQAHLRSPVLRGQIVDASPSPVRFYRYPAGFVLDPQRLGAKPVQTLRFSISETHLERRPHDEPSSQGGLSKRIDSSSLLYRLRCCKIEPTGPVPEEKKWVLQDSDWPESLYFNLNSNPLEVRRKLHYGKCLPIDLTSFVATDNTLTVYLNRSSTDDSPFNYAVAVEVIAVTTRELIQSKCLSASIISSSDVRRSIVKSLSSTDQHGDDELAVVQSNLTICLFEPFSASKVFDIPVRGIDCAHRQAFDLDIFLETRTLASGGEVSRVDVWKCPFCGEDARPQSLVIDGFLVEVRKELESKNLLRTREIVFKEDGTWTPKIEDTDVGEDDASDGEAQHTAAVNAPSKAQVAKRAIEVISLD